MPKDPNEILEWCCVYKIQSLVNPELVYYGSTNNFKRRAQNHKDKYTLFLKGSYHYVSVFDIITLGDYTNVIMCNYNNITRRQLEENESVFISSNKCVNRQGYGKTRYQINKDYFERNKDKILARARELRKINSEINSKINSEKIFCIECNKNISRGYKGEHLKTNKHLKAVKLQKQINDLSNKVNNIKPKIKLKLKQTFNINYSSNIDINTNTMEQA